MVTTDPQAVAWSIELRSSGRVTADVGRGRAAAYLLVGLWMLVVAVSLLVLGGVGGRLFGGFLLAITLALLTTSTQQLVRAGSWRSPQVVVDAEGITVRHGWLRAPWSEVHGATASRVQHNRWVSLALSAECYEEWRAGRRWPLRLLGRRPRRRHAVLRLPPNLAVDHEAFAAWITHECEDRLRARIEVARQEVWAVSEAERLAEEQRLAELPDQS